MDDRTQEIVAMIRASEGKEPTSAFRSLTDEQFADIVDRGGFKDIQNIYDAGWRKQPVATDPTLAAKRKLICDFLCIYATLKARKVGLLDAPKDTISDGALLFIRTELERISEEAGISFRNLLENYEKKK